MAKTTLSLDNVRARAVRFARDEDRSETLIVEAEETEYRAFHDKYDQKTATGYTPAKRATGVNIDGTEERFFAIAVADTYDPPVAIVRADHEQDALEHFVEELNWAHISEADLTDYAEFGPPDKSGKPEVLDYRCGFGPNGEPYDSESIVMWEVFMVEIVLA